MATHRAWRGKGSVARSAGCVVVRRFVWRLFVGDSVHRSLSMHGQLHLAGGIGGRYVVVVADVCRHPGVGRSGLSNAGLSKNQGNAAPTLYELARSEYGGPAGAAPASLARCNSNNGTTGTSKCVFYNITTGGNSTQCVQLSGQVTPDCYFYGTSQNFLQFYGPTLIGLTSTSATTYNSTTAAYAARPGWSFANGLGSVNAGNLVSAWKAFVNSP